MTAVKPGDVVGTVPAFFGTGTTVPRTWWVDMTKLKNGQHTYYVRADFNDKKVNPPFETSGPSNPKTVTK